MSVVASAESSTQAFRCNPAVAFLTGPPNGCDSEGMRSFRWMFVVVVAGLASCPEPRPAVATPTAPGEALACTKDDDCHTACGPCGVGDVITRSAVHAECVVNPCPNVVAVCTDQKKCVIVKSGGR